MIFLDSERELLEVIAKAAADKKAYDIEAIEVRELTSVTDYFMICTGTSSTHIKALCDAIDLEVEKKLGLTPRQTEGYNDGNWILLDYGGVIVHIFLSETRRFYSLECLWSSAPKVDLSDITSKLEAGV